MKYFYLFCFSLCLSVQAQAFQCHTPRHEIEFSVENDTLVFYSDETQGRSVASRVEVQTFKTSKSLTQAFAYQGEHHVIHFQDVNHPSAEADYYMRTNDEGQSMLYPLHCQGKKALVSLR